MLDDLLGLEISRKELQKLTNLPVNDELIIISHPLQGIVKRFIEKVKGSEGATVIFIGLSVLVGSYVAIDLIIRFFATWVAIPSWLLLIILGFLTGSSAQIFLYFFWKQRLKLVEKKITHSLKILLNDVERYNSVIKAIDINDQIEAAGNPGVSLKERQKVLEALELTRSDLVRALKTEKILRENKKFIISRSELFANNLATLTAMQVSEQASEHGRLLNEALQIALDVQHEMKSLQSQG
ncbi:hypothetical protein WA1_37855 [Scytonema hofmannii PCC 7110]|uniref:Uncharacterized protein n=1 Tax=Scytonema hofmannii PCC 7110 TaxID=128403 RepID=A0A139X0A5_9CYAN|nr:hypothetical protein [Scytonema hofmannii]KYC38118.1 hypothetical protein WA1_37855 [Scytonema hofmannii PCC 7110]